MQESSTEQNRVRSFSPESIKRVIQGVFFLLIFAAFPIIVLQISLHQIDKLEIEKTIAHSQLQHQILLDKIKIADNVEKMVGRSIVKIFRQLQKTRSIAQQTQLVKNLNKSYPGYFDLYIFDHKYRLIKNLSSKRHPSRAIEFALEAIYNFSKGKKFSSGKTGILKSIIGLEELPRTLKARGKVIKLGNRKRDSYLTWEREEDKPENNVSPAGYFALLHPESFHENHALENSLKWVNKRFNSLSAGYINLLEPEKDVIPIIPGSNQSLRPELIKASSEFKKGFSNNQEFGLFQKRSPHEFIFTIAPKPIFFSTTTKSLLHLISILWLLLVLKNLPTTNKQISGKITARLVLLFLFAIGTPSLVLMVGGYYSLKDRAIVLQQNLEKKIVSKLTNFDERFPEDLGQFEAYFRKITAETEREKDPVLMEKAFFRANEKKSLIMHGLLVNAKGEPVFSIVKSQSKAYLENRKIVLLVARELLARLSKSTKVDSGTLMMEATEDFVASMMGSSSFDFDMLVRDLGTFVVLSFSDEGSYLFTDVVNGPDGKAKYITLFVLNRARIERHFLNKKLKELQKQPDIDWTVNAYGINRISGKVLTTPENEETLRNIRDKCVSRNSSLKEIVSSGTEEILWYAKPGAFLSDFILIARTTMGPLKVEISRQWWYLIGLATMIFLTSGYIGLMLSNQFLKPIEDITAGVKAIEKRNFDLKIPIHSKDELGELSELMNSVLEGMKDLQVASIVQGSLFPPEPLIAGDYEVYGQSRAMTDIGGDYFDYFLQDGNLLFGLVGDVSGHGVSAALIMGMAKHAFASSTSGNIDLVDTLMSFNKFLLSNIKRKKMMTLFFYCVNLENNELEYSNAGHNYPLWYHKNSDTVDSIEMDSFPLGIRAKSKYKSQKISMEHGDCILMYTDGLIEATNRAGEVLGFDNAMSWFKGVSNLSTQESISKLFDLFDEATDGLPAEDDISLIILKRN